MYKTILSEIIGTVPPHFGHYIYFCGENIIRCLRRYETDVLSFRFHLSTILRLKFSGKYCTN